MEILERAREEVEVYVTEYVDAANSYNDTVHDAQNFCHEIGYQMRKYYDEQSREWRESKEGQELIDTAYMWTDLHIERAEGVDEYFAPQEDEDGDYKKFESLPTHREEVEDEEEAA